MGWPLELDLPSCSSSASVTTVTEVMVPIRSNDLRWWDSQPRAPEQRRSYCATFKDQSFSFWADPCEIVEALA